MRRSAHHNGRGPADGHDMWLVKGRRRFVALLASCSVLFGCGSGDDDAGDGGEALSTSTISTISTTTIDVREPAQLAGQMKIFGRTVEEQATCIASAVSAERGVAATSALFRDVIDFVDVSSADRQTLARAFVDCMDLRRPGAIGLAVTPRSGGVVTEEQRVCASRGIDDDMLVDRVASVWIKPAPRQDDPAFEEWVVATGDCLDREQVVATVMLIAGPLTFADEDKRRCYAEELIARVGQGEAYRIDGRSRTLPADAIAIAAATAACR